MTDTPKATGLADELLPCPFCGGEARRFTIKEDGDNFGGDVIACIGKCGASSHVEFGRKENLVSLWNERAVTLPIFQGSTGEPPAEWVDAARAASERVHADLMAHNDQLGQAVAEGIARGSTGEREESPSDAAIIESYRQMHDTAVELGYSSILEALEALATRIETGDGEVERVEKALIEVWLAKSSEHPQTFFTDMARAALATLRPDRDVLVEALERISAMCPVTTDMSTAHMMAAEADEALEAYRKGRG